MHAGTLRRILLALTVSALALSTAAAQTGEANAQSKPAASPATSPTTRAASEWPKIKFEKYKLKNGLEVILSEDHRLPRVAVNLWYHVGPANERPGLTGFAHLFEHMMFQGSQNVGEKAHFRYLEAAGARAGSDINGTTDFDRTNYFETVPSNQLELALWLESDRMGFLLPTLDGKKLENQRDVVRNERREGENQPYLLAEEELFHQLFPKGHPYYAYVIGSHADLESARLDDVRQFSKQYYAPNNASLAIVGDFDPVMAKRWVEKYFGPIPAGPPVPKIDAKTPPITQERRATVTDKIELPKVYMAWITAPIYKPGDAEAELLAQILGGGKSSRLYKKLVYEKQIAQQVNATQQSLLLGSVFQVEALAKPGVKLEDLEKAINEEIEAVRRDGVTDRELERARNLVQTTVVRGLQTLGGFGGVADRLNEYNHFFGDPDKLQWDLARYSAATTADLKKIADTYLRPNQRAVVYTVPGEKKLVDVPKTTEEEKTSSVASVNIPGQEWRKTAPKPAALSKVSLPTPRQFKLANGMTVLLTEQNNLPLVAARVVTLSGSDKNPADRPGLSSFTADMLDEGTKNRSTLQLADDVAQIGATLAAASTSDGSSVTTSALKRNSDQAFDLLADVVLSPAFDEKELERVRKQRLTTLMQINDEPGSVAARVFYRAVYGTKHPYGYIEIGTEPSIKSTTRDDLVKFWQASYTPSNSALVVAGNISEAELRRIAEKHFGAWKGPQGNNAAPEFDGTLRSNIFLVDKPGSPQTQLRVGTVGVPRSHPDYAGLEVMNAALGGTFSSRINMNLREKNGYSYGAFSFFSYRRGPGPWSVVTGVRTDATGAAIREIMQEVQSFRGAPVTPQELTLAKESVARTLPALFETTETTTAATSDLFLYTLPLDYYQRLPSRIDAVTAADVSRLAQRHLDPKSIVIVAVGDRSKIEPELRKLEYGQVELRNVEGETVVASQR